jgi:anhydro-N-acetylmuramic acid kinase
MSGTSLDGIDLAQLLFQISENGVWSFKILKSETIPYSLSWKEKLQEAISFSKEKIVVLDETYTRYLAKIISEFINKNKINNLDAVCSHGHTIWHQPENGITLQIGNLPILAKFIGHKVICDFRVQDVEMGGNGAPLVPIGDRLLFSKYDYCLNLGGFANISFEHQEKRIAYDVCPVNIVMNKYAELIGKPYDEDGEIAASGKLNSALLDQLNNLNYYKKSAPKSLGLEWVQDKIFPLLDDSENTAEDVLHTFVEHIAIQLANQFIEGTCVLISGGGVYNKYLINRLKYYSNVKIVMPSSEHIEYKEALIFGLLGVLKLRDENNCLSSVTGAIRDHSSGKIIIP